MPYIAQHNSGFRDLVLEENLLLGSKGDIICFVQETSVTAEPFLRHSMMRDRKEVIPLLQEYGVSVSILLEIEGERKKCLPKTRT
jgi:hypothetical protein